MIDQEGTDSQSEPLSSFNTLNFETLYNQYFSYVYYQAYHKIGPDAAEDVRTEVFIKIYKALPTFTPKTEYSYQAWVKTITRNAVIDFLRKNKREIAMEDEHIELFAAKGNQSHQKEEGSDIEEMIDGIDNEEIQDIARLLYYDGKTIEEIAEEKGVSSGSIRKKLFRFRKKRFGIFIFMIIYLPLDFYMKVLL